MDNSDKLYKKPHILIVFDDGSSPTPYVPLTNEQLLQNDNEYELVCRQLVFPVEECYVRELICLILAEAKKRGFTDKSKSEEFKLWSQSVADHLHEWIERIQKETLDS